MIFTVKRVRGYHWLNNEYPWLNKPNHVVHRRYDIFVGKTRVLDFACYRQVTKAFPLAKKLEVGESLTVKVTGAKILKKRKG